MWILMVLKLDRSLVYDVAPQFQGADRSGIHYRNMQKDEDTR